MSENHENDAGPQREAQELVLEIWRQRQLLVESGEFPEKVVLSIENYQKLQDYRARLGELSAEQFEYLARHRVFDLDIYIDNDTHCEVRS